MPIDFGNSTLQSFSALKPQKTIYSATPSKVQNSYKMYLPSDFTNAFNLNKGDTIYFTYSETEDLLHLEQPSSNENYHYIKQVRVHEAGYSTRFVIFPKKLIVRYPGKITRVTLAQIDTSKTFRLLFYNE